jgi:hypothetical protein
VAAVMATVVALTDAAVAVVAVALEEAAAETE